VPREHQEVVERLDYLERVEQLVYLDHLEERDLLELLVLLVQPVLLEHRVPLDLPGFLDQPE